MADDLKPEVPGISVLAASDDEANSDKELNDDTEKFSDSETEQENYNSRDDKQTENNKDLSNAEISEMSKQLNGVQIDDDNLTFSSNDIVGDRILIERDGKFELVDAAEVKAEYFQMMGIEQEDSSKTSQDEKPALNGSDSANIDGIANNETKSTYKSKDESHDKKPRPKTSPFKLPANRTGKNNRANSAIVRKPNDEYSHIKSRYAMTEHQLEMKKRREEAIAKRKKEEEERLYEENKRKRDEAERAFQAWLKMKNEEALEKRKLLIQKDPRIEEEKTKAAQGAYEVWLLEKSKQRKQEKVIERRKLEEEASSYVIREREACDEAFNRWLRRKRAEERKKLAAKKPKKKRRAKKKRIVTEPAPINASSIRFTDYYGYRNTVAL